MEHRTLDCSFVARGTPSRKEKGHQTLGIMSSLSHTHERTDLKHRNYSLILALVCMWLALVVANAVFAAFA
jgi:hypothetical protein